VIVPASGIVVFQDSDHAQTLAVTPERVSVHVTIQQIEEVPEVLCSRVTIEHHENGRVVAIGLACFIVRVTAKGSDQFTSEHIDNAAVRSSVRDGVGVAVRSG
jgi:hypothetical protein